MINQNIIHSARKVIQTHGNLLSSIMGVAFPLYNPTSAPIPQIQTPQATTPAATSKQTKVNQIEPKQNISTLNPMEELNNLIGLSSIKKDVSELIGLVKIMKMREGKGMKTVPTSLHLVFTGNPGTGKTTVARILASLYKEIGVLISFVAF